jgi:Carboxyl transferase domain/Malonate decarboxylase gamma subunit (MdcE)
MKHLDTLNAVKTETGFAPMGDAVGNLTLGRGRVAGAAVHIALVENKIASGSLGQKECDKLASLFRIVATQKTPLLLYLDSAGARVSEGLPALGAFRHMYRAALDMAASGAPFVCTLGANCYGGASMLASLANERVFSDNTQFAMSGPTILAQSAGASAIDEVFRAIAEAAIGADARVKLSATNSKTWSRAVPEPAANTGSTWHQLHLELGERWKNQNRPQSGFTLGEPQIREELKALYPDGYKIEEEQGILYGRAKIGEEKIRLMGIVDRQPLTAQRAWALADRVWALCLSGKELAGSRLNIVVDCEAHSTTLDDEKIMLSQYMANLAMALMMLGRRGVYIETTVLRKLGGGVYVALAAASVKVNLLHGAEIQLLPGRAIASILGDAAALNSEGKAGAEAYVAARVIDQELRVGLIRKIRL